jgi:integrase
LQRDYPGVVGNPATAIGKIGSESEKDRVLTDSEIKTFWHTLPKLRTDESTVRCLKFILATGQRPSECLFISRSEIEGHWWTIPKERMKTASTRKDNIREHRVYLTDLALELLGSDDMPFPVPSHVSALSYALRRAYTPTKKKVVRLPVDPFTPHDLRRTAATLMAESGVTQEVVNKVLGHTMDKIQRTYNRYSYDKEKEAAMTILEEKIITLTA